MLIYLDIINIVFIYIYINSKSLGNLEPFPSSKLRSIPTASLRDLAVAGPWPGAPVVSRADARQAQMEVPSSFFRERCGEIEVRIGLEEEEF